MGTISNNLYLYEVVLLFLGAFLFAILCAGLVYYIVKKEDFKKLLYFFPVAIIMIGYPSIKEIQVGNSKIAMKEYQEQLLEDPDDLETKKKFENLTEKLEKRASSVEDLKAVSEANLLLGNPDKAIDLTNKAIEKKQANPEKNDGPAESDEVGDSSVKDKQDGNTSLATLKNIKELAKIQKEMQSNPSAFQDTLKLKAQIKEVTGNNPKARAYLTKQILRQRRHE